jgi:RimJ/RimL family protein N-acetyltransferase
MVGDVNLFLKDSETEDGGPKKEAEVEVMIAGSCQFSTPPAIQWNISNGGVPGAERQYRRKGFAYEALGLFLSYVTHEQTGLALSPYQLVVRIGSTNVPSRTLFERLGFAVSKEVPVFDEVEMRWRWNAMGLRPVFSETDIKDLWGSGGKSLNYPWKQY